MSERRRRYSFYEIGPRDPIVEERRPERARSPVRQRRKTVIFTSSPVRSRRQERVERSPSPIRYIRRPRAPTPPPRSYTPLPTTIIMPPKQTPASRPLSNPNVLPPKKEDNKTKTGTKPNDKSKEGPRVKVYERGHKQQGSADTGYVSGFSSPWSVEVEERSPLDYLGASALPPTPTVPKSPKPRVDKEPYEIITADGRPRYIKTGNDRKKDAPATTERKRDPRYVIRTPESPGVEAEIVPTLSAKPSKASRDSHAPTRRATQVLQEQLAREPEKSARPQENTRPEKITRPLEATRLEDSQRLAELKLKQLEADIQKMKLEQQIAEGRAAETERRLKQQQKIDEVERRDRELKKQQAEEQQKREASLARREARLAKQQWDEIEATPPPSAAPPRRTVTLVEPGQVSRRHTLMTPYGSGALTSPSTQSPSLLDTENPFLAPILEAQRDEDARRAREAKEDRRRGTVVKETARSMRPRRRDGDDRYHN